MRPYRRKMHTSWRRRKSGFLLRIYDYLEPFAYDLYNFWSYTRAPHNVATKVAVTAATALILLLPLVYFFFVLLVTFAAFQHVLMGLEQVTPPPPPAVPTSSFVEHLGWLPMLPIISSPPVFSPSPSSGSGDYEGLISNIPVPYLQWLPFVSPEAEEKVAEEEYVLPFSPAAMGLPPRKDIISAIGEILYAEQSKGEKKRAAAVIHDSLERFCIHLSLIIVTHEYVSSFRHMLVDRIQLLHELSVEDDELTM